MPQKKKDGMGLEKPVSEVHADHELFLQAFESESVPLPFCLSLGLLRVCGEPSVRLLTCPQYGGGEPPSGYRILSRGSSRPRPLLAHGSLSVRAALFLGKHNTICGVQGISNRVGCQRVGEQVVI